MWIKGYMFVGTDHHPIEMRDDIQVSGWEEAQAILETAKNQAKALPKDQIHGYLFTLVERRKRND